MIPSEDTTEPRPDHQTTVPVDPKPEGGEPESGQSLVRLVRPVVYHPHQGKEYDHSVIAPRFYSAFNYGLLSKGSVEVSYALGVTSANTGEGKSLVASNLAVSLATSTEVETVIVDMNLRNPRTHAIFGTAQAPGLLEALDGSSPINVHATSLGQLFTLPIGAQQAFRHPLEKPNGAPRKGEPGNSKLGLGLEQLASFRNLIYSLKQEFGFVIIDLPSVEDPRVPGLVTQQIDGLLIVVDSQTTKHDDIERVFRHVNNSQVVGFVINKSRDVDA